MGAVFSLTLATGLTAAEVGIGLTSGAVGAFFTTISVAALSTAQASYCTAYRSSTSRISAGTSSGVATRQWITPALVVE